MIEGLNFLFLNFVQHSLHLNNVFYRMFYTFFSFQFPKQTCLRKETMASLYLTSNKVAKERVSGLGNIFLSWSMNIDLSIEGTSQKVYFWGPVIIYVFMVTVSTEVITHLILLIFVANKLWFIMKWLLWKLIPWKFLLSSYSHRILETLHHYTNT